MQEVLFNSATLFDALHAQSRAIRDRVQSVAEAVLRARSDVELIDDLASDLQIAPLELDDTGRTMRREEIRVDVSRDPMRAIFHGNGPVLIPGIRVTVITPFSGDHHLWKLQPSTFNLAPPRGSIRASRDGQSGSLEIIIEQPADQPIEQIKQRLQEIDKNINFFISNQRNDLAGYDGQLRREIASAISDRRSRLVKHDGLADLLGIPEAIDSEPKIAPKPVRPAGQSSSAGKPAVETKSWDVFISHASEDKNSFARPLAEALEAEGLSVWFDESTLTLGDSLRRSIDKGLARSRYGIVIVSEAFLSKEWPQRELDGLVAREDDGGKVVLPIWHNITVSEVRRHSPTLADRLAISSSKGVATVVGELLRVVRNGTKV